MVGEGWGRSSPGGSLGLENKVTLATPGWPTPCCNDVHSNLTLLSAPAQVPEPLLCGPCGRAVATTEPSEQAWPLALASPHGPSTGLGVRAAPRQ